MEMTTTVREVYLRPGDFCFGDDRLRITTVLGSCVAILLWHPLRAHGGMCHFMLPSRNQSTRLALEGRYGDEAMALFMLELRRRHTVPGEYQVHVYGGGNMFYENSSSSMDIGKQNIGMACRMLDEYGFTLTKDHLGSFGHRKIAFDIWSGEVRLVHVVHGKT